MQTSFPKIATVILAITAVSFMGMAVAAYYGRPDPIAEMHSPEINEFNFEAVPSAAGMSWTVTPSVGDDTAPKQKDNAYQAILEAYEHKEARLATETAEMNAVTEQLRERLKAVEAEQEQDDTALKSRGEILKAEVQRVQFALEQASVQFQKLSVDTRAIRDETTKRREDVIRLQNDLEELRTDLYRLKQLRLILTDRLLRLQLENEALQLRQQQLNDQSQP